MDTSTASTVDRSIVDYSFLNASLPAWSDAYANADPYPHISIDNFLKPDAYKEIASAFPSVSDDRWIHYVHFNEQKHGLNRFDSMPDVVKQTIKELNSPEFVAFLSKLTGIDGLMADDSMEGGGLHQSRKGGYLRIHADFTGHPHNKNWRRRANVLVYFNDDWEDEYGGHLELWTRDMKRCAQKLSPVGNRCIVFSTDETSYHGHPEPLTCPEDMTRKSIALYYYTPDMDAHSARATKYRARPMERGKSWLINLDNNAVAFYSTMKRRLGFKDGWMSSILNFTNKFRKN